MHSRKIVPARGRYRGILQIAEGGPSNPMIVEVSVDREKIRFEIPISEPMYGGASFNFVIDGKGIKGTMKYKNGATDAWNLLRGKSYWDK
jgi:hypothetical protein